MANPNPRKDHQTHRPPPRTLNLTLKLALTSPPERGRAGGVGARVEGGEG